MKSASPGMIYFVRFFAARACSRTFRPCAFNSFSLRCKVRRLIPSCVAAAVMFPPVELSAWVISRFSVSAKSSGFAVSETVIAPPDVPAASRIARGKETHKINDAERRRFRSESHPYLGADQIAVWGKRSLP